MVDRYFIFLQPLIALLIAYFVILISKYLKEVGDVSKRNNFLIVSTYILLFAFALNVLTKWDILKGRYYELTHVYLGPMDYIVGYINENYPNPSDLTIDTNIEQTVLMYYLGSSVNCDDSETCYKSPVDIIIPRRGYIKKDFAHRIDNYTSQASYEKVELPILDYPSNNIPELSLGLRHLFKTPKSDDPSQMVFMLVKVNK